MTAERMADHWWWRPGWGPGRRFYTWHFTFADQPAISALVRTYQTRLSGLPDLDMIPARWLHLTTQGIAFTNEIDGDALAAIVTNTRDRLKKLPPLPAIVGPARVTPEAILLDVEPAGGISAIRDGIRAAIGTVQGTEGVPEGDDWRPHISVAYSSGTSPAAPYIDAVTPGDSAECTISSVELIELNRDNRMYEWTTVAKVMLQGAAALSSKAACANALDARQSRTGEHLFYLERSSRYQVRAGRSLFMRTSDGNGCWIRKNWEGLNPGLPCWI